ncbi:methionine biosynthesis protein MetW [Rhodococcus sp. G-MC3]|nr:methionine biosynthesis protein MetW [Rhodococcus sp. G-MC3]MDJ0395550.1 methionine biosynthesis protein MetW [Rhodococcus sp. G-MC3]
MFKRAEAGLPCWIRDTSGVRRPLPVERWMGWTASAADRFADHALLAPCTGPTLDLGCGPGRLTAALTARGVSSLGVDRSATAVAMTIRRGGKAIRQDIFDTLPDAGRWAHVLLADGNIGIGGDPLRLLCKARDLIAAGGTVITEIDPPTTALRYELVRWETDTAVSGWFPWASVGTGAITELAAAAGLHMESIDDIEGRFVARLRKY